MKISIDNVEILTLSDLQKQVIKNDIPVSEFDADMKRRVTYILTHKYERCFERLKSEWDQKLADNGVKMIPTDKDEYAKLVFAQPNYKDRAKKDLEISKL